jgi:hypothetical protein
METLQESPAIRVMEMAVEGVLCASNPNMDMDSEEGYM